MFIIRSAILLIFPLIFSCAGGNSSLWKPYFFDGKNFSPAAGTNFKGIWLRSGHFPVTAEQTPESTATDRLPTGTGAVAGICYIQSSGGKISGHEQFSPYPDEQITFKSKTEGVYVTRTGKDGYFTEYLTAGDYEVFCRGVRAEFRVKRGETTLVPIRGGKRMVD
jgi:hypothetical protein